MGQAWLIRELDAAECARRNALTSNPRELSLAAGTVLTVLDTLSEGEAFLMEFGSSGPTQCQWLGVLYASELEFMRNLAHAA